MAWGVRNLISTQVYAPAPAGPTGSLELRAARGRLAEDSAYIRTNRSHPTALRRASVMERALHFTAAVQAVGATNTHENYDVPGSRSWRRSSVAAGARGAPSKVMIDGLFGSASCPPS